MYLLAFKRKKELFKKNNKFLFQFLLIVIILISPVLLFVAPLPGFLILDKNQTIESIMLGALIFLVLAVFESLSYWLYWKKKEIEYLNYISTHKTVIKDSFIVLLKTCVLFHMFVLSTFFITPELSLYSVVMFILLTYPVLLFVFFLVYKIKLISIGSEINLLIPFKIGILLLKGGVIIKLLFIGLFTFANYIFTNAVTNEEAKLFNFFMLNSITLFFCYLTYNALIINLKSYSLYLNSINEELLIKIKNCILLLFSILAILNLIIGFPM